MLQYRKVFNYKSNIKFNFYNLILLLLLFLNVTVAGISSTSSYTLIVKSICSLALIVGVFVHAEKYRNGFIKFLTKTGARRIILISMILIIYLAVTVIYSTNKQYGLQKIGGFIISVIPNITGLYYVIKNISKSELSYYFIISCSTLFIFLIVTIFFFSPFDQSIIYEFSIGRWSHVFVGRNVSLLTLIVFWFFISSNDYKKIIFYAFIFLVGFTITYLTGLRAAIISLLLFSFISFIYAAINKYLTKTHYLTLISILILTFVLTSTLYSISSSTINSTSTLKRLENLFDIDELKFGGDPAIHTRIASYNIAWKMFTESPVIGKGLGSFNGYDNLDWTTIQKYPHNIVLEILSELGIIGFLLFLLLCYLLIRKMLVSNFSLLNSQYSKLTSHFLLITFFFSLFLAMFSKDLSTQNLLWLFLVVFSGDLNNKSADNSTDL